METAKEYLRRRAEEEHAAADRASNAQARELHLELARRYLDAATSGLPVPSAGSILGADKPGLPSDFRILE